MNNARDMLMGGAIGLGIFLVIHQCRFISPRERINDYKDHYSIQSLSFHRADWKDENGKFYPVRVLTTSSEMDNGQMQHVSHDTESRDQNKGRLHLYGELNGKRVALFLQIGE